MATTQRTGPTDSALIAALGQVTTRLRRQRLLRDGSRGALIAVVLSLLAVGLAHWSLLPLWLPLEAALPALLLIGVVAGTVTAYAHPIDIMAAARLAESRLGLKERLSSALEFERSGQTPRDPEAALLLRLQQEDAAAHARRLQAADAVPLQWPWEARALLPASILLLLALGLPALPFFVPPALRTERAVVQKSGQNLSTTAHRIESSADSHNLPATKRAAQKMQALSRRMQAGRMDKKQAMVEMSKLRQQIADQQKQLGQSGADPGQSTKTLDQAGRQLAQSLPSGAGENGSQANGTPEVQQSSKAMQQNDAPALSEHLRQLAQRIQSGSMSPSQQAQTAQDLQKLANSLQGTPLSETQKHVQAAADALRQGDRARAADELRRAADAAQHETRQQQDAQGLQQAQQELQNNERQMAQASKPGDVPRDQSGGQAGQQGQSQGQSGSKPGNQSGQGDQPGQGTTAQQGQGKGQGQGQSPGENGQNGSGTQGGAPGNTGEGAGKSAANTPGPGHYTPASGQGQTTPGRNTGIVRGAAHPLDPKFDPSKNPNYGKVYLGAGTNGPGARVKTLPGQKSQAGTPAASAVPYTRDIAPARQNAESAMDKEDVPPSYRSGVRRYFDSLQPTTPK